MIYKYITKNEDVLLKQHLDLFQSKFDDITLIFDRSGYSPLHYAAFKNYEQCCFVLCQYLLNRKKGFNQSFAGGVEQSSYSMKGNSSM